MSSRVSSRRGVSPPDVENRQAGLIDVDGRMDADFLIESATGKVLAPDRWLVRRLLHAIGSPPIGVVLWDGEEISASDLPAVAHVFVSDRPTLLKLLWNPSLHFGDAYSTGRIKVKGDLLEFLQAVYRAKAGVYKPPGALPRSVTRWWRRWRTNSPTGSRASIHHHYDLGEDFYRLWLDDEMVYSGAYFCHPQMTLEEAQRAKLDYVCRKLRLRRGETVVEVGGGWGALALYMARHYGVRVKAFNISRPQTLFARRRAAAEGLGRQVEFIEDDYRNISGRFDAFVSLGMLEHVGVEYYREFGRVMDRCLSRNGRGLMQSIGQNRPEELTAWTTRRIFPGVYPPSLREMMNLWESWGFSILDVENLRLHYAWTLTHWLARFESAAAAVAEMFDRRFVRMWRLYLTGSAAAFTAGVLQLFQVVFARPEVNEIPLTREELYIRANARDQGN